LSTTGWNEGEPNGQLVLDTERMGDLDCNDTVFAPHPALCEVERWSVRPADRHAYRVFHDPKTWSAAQQACRGRGGHLASLVVPDTYVWIGATDSAVEGTFPWETGEPSQVANYAPGQPNDLNGGEDCLVREDNNGAWHDSACGQSRPYICELD
jgi:hypothetical protein